MTDREAMKMALDALDMACAKYGDVGNIHTDWGKWDAAGTALRQALAQPEQEPDCGEAGHDEGRCGNFHCITKPATPPKPEQMPVAWVTRGTFSGRFQMCDSDDIGAIPVYALDEVKHD